MTRWSFINSGACSGAFNMEFDEYLALSLRDGIGHPTLRLYQWQPRAISLGFNQQMDDFDSVAMDAAGIDIVRRPTGGRAILHANELTYSVVMQIDNQSLRSIYRFINNGLLRGLQYLGIRAELSRSEPDFRSLYNHPSSIPCFSNSAKDEIQYQGRKLVGSAQRRFGPVILQHGSLLLGPEHRHIVDFLAPHARSEGPSINKALTDGTIDAETILGRPISFDEAAVCIRKGFEQECGIVFDMKPANTLERAQLP